MGIDIEAVKKAIKIPEFKHTELLEVALTHPSYIYEDRNLDKQQQVKQERDYRRLAILGDAIFNAVVIDYLHKNDSTLNQGKITDFKNNLVSREKACEFAHKLNLRNICRLGGSAKDKDISDQVSLFGEMFEALVGAIYLNFERNLSPARDWLVNHFIKPSVDELKELGVTEKESSEDSSQTASTVNAGEATLWQKKAEADALIANNEKLQELLTWVYKKSLQVEPDYQPVKVRAFYLALIRLLGITFARKLDPNCSPGKARQFFSCFNRACDVVLDIAFFDNPNTDPANVIVSVFALDFEPELKQALQQIKAELPDLDEEKERFEDWRQNNGQDWIDKIKNILGHDLQLNNEQRNLLKQYYNANRCLLEQLNSNSNVTVTPTVREEIKNKLFGIETLMSKTAKPL
ncbi:ribonuclease III domain-containing protein [Coleofasciculus chthonoplastes]|uniref:ribonuclease III domain-containing protein n=1 Tax=Coleofasciculus chthonoplastes TaxID=64178 RepID=UPI0032FD7212